MLKKSGILLILLAAGILLFATCKNDVTEPTKEEPTVESGPMFEPPDGECLFILGQADNASMEAYMNKLRKDPAPAGFAYYTSLSDGAVQKDMPRYKAFLDKYPNTVLQLAIWTGERQWGNPGYYLDDIVRGRYDQNINALAAACKSFGKPVFIRFGYEFDGWHNAYPPDKYIAAYRYFVNKMRDLNVENVAYVWHSWGAAPYYGDDDFPQYYPPLPNGQKKTHELWYPGDDYVDWLALSVFGIGWGDLSTNDVVQWLITFAENHDKPVMLAEAAAIKTSDRRDTNWVIPNINWFQHVFALCEDEAVKAFTYINVDWEEQNSSSTWGDTQIQNAPHNVIVYWLEQSASFLHATPDLYTKIGYSP
ncbi:hypothetical protein EH223_11165 [candidate division KSB1 bacterium]|nr:hypothetical protein [candidate division KSB1 bacterium]RQW02999.1 MAG: hypothetical protein EH223_11165 [candidate division KSB1 bacterium]